MGKYQLDDKGKAQVARYHEKHSKGGVNKKRSCCKFARTILTKNKEKIGERE